MFTFARLAEIKGLTAAEVCEQTRANACAVFGSEVPRVGHRRSCLAFGLGGVRALGDILGAVRGSLWSRCFLGRCVGRTLVVTTYYKRCST